VFFKPHSPLYEEGRIEGKGIYYAGESWYEPCIIQFNQPDTLIPDQYNPIDWNRYAYARYNPLKYIDPTGHDIDCAANDYECQEQVKKEQASSQQSQYSDWYSGKYSGCSMCHYAHAQNKMILTNEELATADQNARMWEALAYTPAAIAIMGVGGGTVAGMSGTSPLPLSSPLIGKAGVDRVLQILNDPSAQTEVNVYVNEAGKRANIFARFDILTNTAIHEVKNVADLSLSQRLMDQAWRYKQIADGAGLELHYWLMNDAPQRVQSWLQNLGIFVHTP
jgi:RHS repeat-associated protein